MLLSVTRLTNMDSLLQPNNVRRFFSCAHIHRCALKLTNIITVCLPLRSCCRTSVHTQPLALIHATTRTRALTCQHQ